MPKEKRKTLCEAGGRPGLSLQKMNTRNVAVTEAREITKKLLKGQAKVKGQSVVDMPDTAKKMNLKITKKKEQRSDTVGGPTNSTHSACTDSHNEHKDPRITGLNKSQHKHGLTIEQFADETLDSRKGVKHKNSGSVSAKEKSKVKLRKLESCSISSTEHKPSSTEHKPSSTEQKPSSTEQKPSSTEQKPSSTEQKPSSTEHKPSSTEHKPSSTEQKPLSREHKPADSQHKARSSLSTSSAVTTQSGASKQKCKIAQVRSDKIAQARKDKKSQVKADKKAQVKADKIAQVKADKIAQVKSDGKSLMKNSKSVRSNKLSKPLHAAKSKQGTVYVDSVQKQSSRKKERSVFSKHQQKASQPQAPPTVDTSDPMAVLLMMEGRTGNYSLSDRQLLLSAPSTSTSRTADSWSDGDRELDEQATSSEGESPGISDWEEVHDYHVADKSQIPDGPVEITLEMPDIFRHKRRQKKAFDWKAHLDRRVRRFKKEVAENRHKVHLLCLLSLGLRQNEALNDVTVTAMILSLLPLEYLANTKLSVQRQVENLLLWYKRKFPLENVSHCSSIRLIYQMVAMVLHQVTVTSLTDAVSHGAVTDARVWILIFIGMLRTIGMNVRLALSLQPMRFKAHQGWDEKKGGKGHQHCSPTDQPKGGIIALLQRAQVRWTGHICIPDKRIPKQLMYGELSKGKRHVGGQKKGFKDSLNYLTTMSRSQRQPFPYLQPSAVPTTKISFHGASVLSPQTKSDKTPPSSKVRGVHQVPKKNPAPKRRLSRRESSKKATLKNKVALKECDDDDDDSVEGRINDDSDSDFSESSIRKMKVARKKATPAARDDDDDSSSSELEFEESRPSFHNPLPVLKTLKILSNRKILSPATSDDEAAGGKRHGPLGHDIWLEVYMPDSKKWVCFDCFKSEFGKPYSIENSATQPLMYVLAFKNDNSVKDVTARYAKQWLSHTRKNRIGQQWWTETLLMFDFTPFKDNLIEDDEIKGQLLVRPMPTSIGEFKSHPLTDGEYVTVSGATFQLKYALRRHLLKFESIYPDTAIPVGYIRKEPVYARECVHTLHSRDNWLKEGRLVRLNEQPYKMVKSRPKWNKPKENPDALDLELFGEWQTEQYIPMPAVNGKVPRNEYGNVELFKPWMLPKGTVQVRGHGMQRVAKKLNIDVAPAMVGWDNHSGFSHPLMDGWIVCEEFADTLMVAWLEDQEIQKQREMEKREKRVYDNWRLLIRGLLIKERLKNKFLQEAPPGKRLEKQETFSDEETAADVQLSWPRNRQDRLTQERSKIVELKRERERKLVEKACGVDVINFQNVGDIKSDDEMKKGPAKLGTASLSVGNRQVRELVHSESGSSEDEVVGSTLMKPNMSKMKKRRSVEDEDPDFVVCGSHRKMSRIGSEKLVADTTDEDVDGKMRDRHGKKRSSLSRQAKNKVTLMDEASDCDL